MKNHIVFKFLAVLLCALMLVCAAAASMGVFVLNEAGLYQKSYTEAYNAYREEILQQAADAFAARYAATELGGLSEQLVDTYFGSNWQLERFSFGKMGYTLMDAEGNALLTWSQTGHYPNSETIRIQTREGQYPKVERTLTTEQWNEENASTETTEATVEPYVEVVNTVFYDAVPPEGAVVTHISVGYEDSSEGVGSPEGLGIISHNDAGNVEFRGESEDILDVSRRSEITSIRFENETMGLLCEIVNPEGVGLLYTDAEGTLIFQSNGVNPDFAEDAVPEQIEGTPKAVAEESDETTLSSRMVAEPNHEKEDYDLTLRYYDPQSRQEMVALCTLVHYPAYTVEFVLGENALADAHVWRILELTAKYQAYLLPVIVASALLFAIFAVYLCCAAGRKPGSKEVRAGGLNRVPLDVYFIALCCVEVMLALLIAEGVPYFMEGSLTVGLSFGAAMGYSAALVLVAFCFAVAAQAKTPGRYGWNNLLTVRCWFWTGGILEWLGRKLDKWVFPLARRILRALWKFTRTMAVLGWHGLKVGTSFGKRQFRRLSVAAVKFWEKLPMTWQWLLSGFLLIIILALTVNTPLGFWGILATIALVLYGAHAFGTLLGGVKRMNKGDLDNKVNDQLLIGSFRDFAQELNGLADVAVVAAQKQLKSERMRTELITNVSHDIKTPLTSIINYVDLLKMPHSEEEQEAYLEVLSRQSQRLKKLVDDLMELSKASTGNMSVDIICMDAVEAVTQALGEFSDKLEQADLQPVFRQPEEPVKMQADGRLVWRVLSNLLSNAVKYAQPGTRLYVDLNRVEDKVILSVKNISREELNVSAEELLERFVRGDASRNTDGSGLGLNIAQSLMQLQKGELQLLVDGDLFKVTLIFPAAE